MSKKGNINKNIPVCNVDLKRYSGIWFEIAKLPARGQNGLSNVTATYTPKKNGKIRVINKGYRDGRKKGIKGYAWPRDRSCRGGLYVRFFWPFKSEYNVIRLASDYRYAVVAGEDKDSLWILSRKPEMNMQDLEDILYFVKAEGFNVRKLVHTPQSGKRRL
ncbi:lipocalin family protein [Proteiniclasticum sp.]|uniref:lipocalin family protein n=1 Tax=Proteiniclasticum sp. TaxID=2053595 RepID=UPI00289C513C|nr:lipocalin family protein [Proteiniclasticum sp.]